MISWREGRRNDWGGKYFCRQVEQWIGLGGRGGSMVRKFFLKLIINERRVSSLHKSDPAVLVSVYSPWSVLPNSATSKVGHTQSPPPSGLCRVLLAGVVLGEGGRVNSPSPVNFHTCIQAAPVACHTSRNSGWEREAMLDSPLLFSLIASSLLVYFAIYTWTIPLPRNWDLLRVAGIPPLLPLPHTAEHKRKTSRSAYCRNADQKNSTSFFLIFWLFGKPSLTTSFITISGFQIWSDSPRPGDPLGIF